MLSSLPLKNSPSAVSSPLARLNHLRRASEIEPDPTDNRTETSDEDEAILPSSKKRKIQAFPSAREDEDDARSRRPTRYGRARENVLTPPQSRRITQGATPRLSSSLKAIQDLGSAESSEDDAGVILTQPARSKRQISSAQPRPHTVPDGATGGDFVVDDNEVEYISSDSEQAPRRKSGRFKPRAQRSRAEKDEIEDDLADLRDSDGEHEIEGRRTRGGPVQTQRDRIKEHLEVLKRRRAGEKIRRIVDTDEDEELVSDTASNNSMQDFGAEIDQIGVEKLEPLELEPTDDEDGESIGALPGWEEEADDGFVVSDDEAAEDGHARYGLHSSVPLAFTNFASSKPRDLFVHAVEWLVKNKIAPAFRRDDEIYGISWNKINDQFKAQAGSRLISAAWKEDFKNTILARPHMQFRYVGQDHDQLSPNCDACKRTNHPAVYTFTFSGHAYHKDTLETVDEDIDEEEEDRDEQSAGLDDKSSERVSYDEAGHPLPSSHTAFHLGRFCAANAEMGHKLTHWKYQLNTSLLEYLEEQGVLSAEAVVARDKLSNKKREKEADNIIDLMEETGIINEMWLGLQGDLENARHGMEDHRSEHQGGQVVRKGRAGKKQGHTRGRLQTDKIRTIIESDSE